MDTQCFLKRITYVMPVVLDIFFFLIISNELRHFIRLVEDDTGI